MLDPQGERTMKLGMAAVALLIIVVPGTIVEDQFPRVRSVGAPVARQRTEREAGIGDDRDRQRRLERVAAIDDRGGGLGRDRVLQEAVAVEALAAQRDEKLAPAQAARVGRDARDGLRARG